MVIIPAIDVIGGKCVRVRHGDYAQQKTYFEHPLDVAKMFEDAGLKRLHLVDLDGAREKRIINHRVLEAIASKTSLVIDFGGGLQSDEDLRIAFECGAQMITGGSIAVKNRSMFLEWLDRWGSDRIILGADAKDGKIAVSGWQDVTELALIPFIEAYQKQGVTQVICTDISKDGAMQGPAVSLYQSILAALPSIQLIASGGVSKLEDVVQLHQSGLHGVIIGKAIYEGAVSLKDLTLFIQA